MLHVWFVIVAGVNEVYTHALYDGITLCEKRTEMRTLHTILIHKG